MRSYPAPPRHKAAMKGTVERLKSASKKQDRGIVLNEQQRDAVRAIREFLTGDGQFFGLYGYAGTGKTTTIHEALKDFDGKVAMAAPTHKAVGVLSDMDANGDTDFATIHRLLGCRSRWVQDQKVFSPDLSRPQEIHDYDVVVIDECSMVGAKMWGWVQDAVDRMEGLLKVIVMGDPLQLPPVKDGEVSPTFDLPCARLSKIMRHQGVIESAATAMRKAVDADELPLAEDAKDAHGEVVNLGQGEFMDALLADLDRAKVLAYTNKAVDWINAHIREHLFGANADPFEVGERLLLKKTYENGNRGMLYTGTEVKVLSAERATHIGLRCWKLDCQDEHGGRHDLHVFDDDQRPAFKKAIAKARDRGKAGGGWQKFYDLKEGFAEVRPGWATTIHKSQGSTYDHVYVIQTNVLSSTHDANVRKMLLYVGYSRARKKLILS